MRTQKLNSYQRKGRLSRGEGDIYGPIYTDFTGMHLSTSYLLPLCLLNRVYETLFISGSGVYSGGYSIYPWVGRCGSAPHTLTLLKTKIADFPALFKTDSKTFVQHTRRLFIVQEKIPCLRQKLIKSIPCLRQKSRKTYPGWPHVPIKPL